MGVAYIEGGGGGGVMSSDVTASKADILAGKYDIASDSNDEVVQGTMTNRGTWNSTIGINGSVTIPQGYHSGSGKVTQSITTKAAATYYATTSDQTISSGQYLSGAQTIKKLTQTNLTGANIKPGVTISINNGNTNVWSVAGSMASKAATTYYPTTSDQTIAAGQYLSGAQTIKAVSQQNLTAANIKKGVTVYIKNGSGNIYAVTGTAPVPSNRSGAFTASGSTGTFQILNTTTNETRHYVEFTNLGFIPAAIIVEQFNHISGFDGLNFFVTKNGQVTFYKPDVGSASLTSSLVRMPVYDSSAGNYRLAGW